MSAHLNRWFNTFWGFYLFTFIYKFVFFDCPLIDLNWADLWTQRPSPSGETNETFIQSVQVDWRPIRLSAVDVHSDLDVKTSLNMQSVPAGHLHLYLPSPSKLNCVVRNSSEIIQNSYRYEEHTLHYNSLPPFLDPTWEASIHPVSILPHSTWLWWCKPSQSNPIQLNLTQSNAPV